MPRRQRNKIETIDVEYMEAKKEEMKIEEKNAGILKKKGLKSGNFKRREGIDRASG